MAGKKRSQASGGFTIPTAPSNPEKVTWGTIGTGHCGRDPSVVGCCGGTKETCSCECNTCNPPVSPEDFGNPSFFEEDAKKERDAIQAEPPLDVPQLPDIAEDAARLTAGAEVDALVENGIEPSYARVVASIHRVDVEADFARLEKDLAPDPERANYAEIYRYVDRCEDNARIAHKLYLHAQLEYERAKFHAERTTGQLRESAVEALEAEKEGGTRKKAITNDDVLARMRADHGDELLAIDTHTSKMRNARDHLEELSRIWKIRCSSAATMLQTVRR